HDQHRAGAGPRLRPHARPLLRLDLGAGWEGPALHGPRPARAALGGREESGGRQGRLRAGELRAAPHRPARDGTLLIPTAEVASGGPNPQSLSDPRGKILRIGPDGAIPKDNPFLKTPDAIPALYAVGFRDIQGAGLDASGALWVAENEPKGGDE